MIISGRVYGQGNATFSTGTQRLFQYEYTPTIIQHYCVLYIRIEVKGANHSLFKVLIPKQ